MKKAELIRDGMMPSAKEILERTENPWRMRWEKAESLEKSHTETLASLLAFIKALFPKAFNAVERRLGIPQEFLSTLSELTLLFVLHPASSAPKLELVPYKLEYDPGEGSPDIKIDRPNEPAIGIEVTRPEVKGGVNRILVSDDPDPRSVDEKIVYEMHKLFAELEEKVGKFGSSGIKVIALDITDYMGSIFLSEYSASYHIESYLYGQAKMTISAHTNEVYAWRDASELPTVKGEGVHSFFDLHRDVAAVIYFWHDYYRGSPIEGYRFTICSKLAVNLASPEEQKFPWNLAFALSNVMNEGGTFTIVNLRGWGVRPG